MRRAQCLLILMLALITYRAPRHALAGDCERCGCCTGCEKICRLVREEKKVEVTCWGCKCEDFCVPGHSKPGCKHCETVCETCDESGDSGAIYSAPKKFAWTEWIPGCAKIYTKKKLMKRTITKKVPSYKWIVEDLCKQCEDDLPPVAIDPDADVPPPPVVQARILAP